MAETQLQKERLQVLAVKRKRQGEIEEKKRQLEDVILRLQHLKSKAMRERWLLQGTSAATKDEEEERRRQVEHDELEVKRLEDNVYRLETDINLLKSEELDICAREEAIREKLREGERIAVDLHNRLQDQDKDAEYYICSQIPDLPESYPYTLSTALGDRHLPRKAVCAMEVNMEKDRKTGDTRILSACAVSPEEAQQRGVKVFDDGCKVVYEVRSGQSVATENGVYSWNSSDVDKIMQLVNQSGQSPGGKAAPGATATPPNWAGAGDGRVEVQEQAVHKEAKLEMVPGRHGDGTESLVREVNEVPEASTEKPVTMIFMGYHNVEDEEETKKLLGFNGTIKAEIVLIDEDDEKSLREKTVTDLSTIDGNAADLVSGQPLSDTTELSSEGKEESLDKELPPAGLWLAYSEPMTASDELLTGKSSHIPHTSSTFRPSEDASKLKREIAPKTVTFLQSVHIISQEEDSMELDASFSDAPAEMQDSCRHAVGPTDASDVPESLATDAAKNILNSGDVLEVSCWNCDAPSSEASSELKRTFIPDCETFGFQNSEITEGMKQSMFTNSQGFGKYNGYPRTEIQGHRRFPGETADSAIKKESLFELRAFQEERKPSKLFDCMSDKEQVHVKKIRPSEEIAELERERLELIKGQAVKKNPGIAAKWWNPPQEKTLEEELDPDQLESHRKYEERKQKKLEAPCLPQMQHDHLRSPVAPEDPSKEDVVVEQIDFSAARNQFLQMENNKAPRGARRGVTPRMYSAKPFSRSPNNTDVERPNSLTADGFITQDTSEGVTVNEMGVDCRLVSFLEKQSENGTAECEMRDNIQTWVDDGDFTHARAVMAILGDDDAENSNDPYSSEEVRCGIGEISLKPRGLTTEETRSNDVKHDSGNDSGASSARVLLHPPLEDDSSFPSHRINSVNNQVDKSENELSTSDTDHSGILTEEQLEYHAGLLVQNAIQQAIAQQRVQREPSPGPEQTATYHEQHAEAVVRSQSPLREEDKRDLWPLPSHECGRHISIPDASSFAPADASTFAHGEPPGLSPTESSKQEFSYFSKYSEAAELRSTASVARSQDMEVSSGPFRLRSRKQRTLSMIEEEIRAAQEREEELKRQRQTQTLGRGQRQSPGSQPSRLTVTGKTGTAPGTIEKIRIVPQASSPSEGPLPSPLSDVGSDDSGGGQRPKNFMQTLMEDYESHKVKRREQAEDASVLEATRVTRRKSNMAVRWEAGLYANQDEAEAEEA